MLATKRARFASFAIIIVAAAEFMLAAAVASPQTSFGVRSSRIHFAPTCVTNEPQRTSAGRLTEAA